MKTLSELTDYYYKTLYPIIKELEIQRLKIKKKLLFLILFNILVFIISLLLYNNDIINESYIFILLFILLISYTIGYKTITQGYAQKFKFGVIDPLLHAIDPNLHYNPSSHIPLHTIQEGKLFGTQINHIQGKDFVTGSIDSIAISFSDVTLDIKQTTVANKKDPNHRVTLFKGLYIITQSPKKFHGSTIVLPDTAQHIVGEYIGHIVQSYNTQYGELIKMDNIEFEKKFVVYATDQIEARYLLTPSIMEKILLLQKHAKHPIYLSFVNNNIHIAVAYNKNLFEPSVFHSLLEYKIALQYIQTLHLCVEITQELEFNTTLGSYL